MSVWALLPVKDFSNAKSRLGTWLPQAEREELAIAMYKDTLTALADSIEIKRLAVVTSHPEALADARKAGAHCIEDPGLGLNPALEAAREALLSMGATIITVFPTDIPAIRPVDANTIIRTGHETGAAIIVPDHLQMGTNALLLHRNMPLRYSFGTNSFRVHKKQAEENRYPMRSLGLRNVECDCDTPEDILRLAAIPPGERTTRSFRNLKIAPQGPIRLAQ